MEKVGIYIPLKRSKSMCSLPDYEESINNVPVRKRYHFCNYRRTQSRTSSDSSVDICVVIDSDSDDADSSKQPADSGICFADKSASDGQMLQVLEQKIDRLSDIFQEQCRLLTTLKEDVRNSKTALEKADIAQKEILADLVKKAVHQKFGALKKLGSDIGDSKTNHRARILLDAIEARQGVCDGRDIGDDREVRDVMASFLQSDELKGHIVAATAESVKDVIGDCLSRDVSSLYLPVLEQSHRRLVRQVTNTVEQAFIDLEDNSACLTKSVYKTTKSLQLYLERHQKLLEVATDPRKNLMNTLKRTVEELLHQELQQWRQELVDVLSPQLQEAAGALPVPAPPLYSPASPPAPNRSIIDQLMTAAEISKQIQDGDVNAAFERALCAANLALVMAACREANALAFSPHCRLQQHVLLSLLQQLSTDMIHDTNLKCRYLEDSIISVDPSNALARAHLPLVIGELRKHLTKFLSSYPRHVASRRVALIIMAAENLLN